MEKKGTWIYSVEYTSMAAGVPLHRDTCRHGMRARRRENCAIDMGESVSLGPSHHDMAMAESHRRDPVVDRFIRPLGLMTMSL